MKLKNHVSLYITSVLVLTTVLIANNQLNKSNVSPTTSDKAVSQQALSDTTVKTADTAPTKAAAPTTTDTTVKPSTSTVSTPKTTVKASTTTTATATETPTEPVTPPTLTEEERVYKFANIDSSKISSNSLYTLAIDKLSVPDSGHINIQVSPLGRWSASIKIVQALSGSQMMISTDTQGSWNMNSDGTAYSNIYKENMGISFNSCSQINLYIFITPKDGTVYQYKYTITKSN